MKKLFFYAMAGLLTMGTVSTMTSCGDDDPVEKPTEKEVLADKVTGTYKGTLDITLVGAGSLTPTPLPKNITITKAADDAVNMELLNFSFMNIPIGDIAVKDCKITQTGDTYTFSGTQTLDLTSKGVGNCDVEVNGTVVGNDVTINLDINVKDGILKGQQVKVTYKGTKLTGNESSEAKILTFVFDKSVAAVDSLVIGDPEIDETAKTISFYVADTAKAEQLKELVPTITVSDKATVSPNSNEKQDFNNPVTYTVTAENGTTVQYTAAIKQKVSKYDFETWGAPQAPSEEAEFLEVSGGWSSSNGGAYLLKGFGALMGIKVDTLCVNQDTKDKHSGNLSASIITLDTQGKETWGQKIPKVTTGSLFLGNFITNMKNTLASTKFGIPYSNKPVTVKGWFKYAPGKEYYEVTKTPYKDHCHEATLNTSKSDEYMISAVLYETEAYDTNDWTDCLTGVDIYTSDRVVAIAQQTGGAQADWKEFTLTLDYKKTYDASKKYRFAIICSASKDGDKFSGAPGSNLKIDDIEVFSE